jgi:hypothetical protein
LEKFVIANDVGDSDGFSNPGEDVTHRQRVDLYVFFDYEPLVVRIETRVIRGVAPTDNPFAEG